MSTSRLTLDREELLETIADLENEHTGHGGPTPKELAEHLPFCPNTVSQHCRELEAAGTLEMQWRFDTYAPTRGYVLAEAVEVDR